MKHFKESIKNILVGFMIITGVCLLATILIFLIALVAHYPVYTVPFIGVGVFWLTGWIMRDKL